MQRTGPGPLILIVDDEPAVRAFIATVLRRDGMDPVEAADGAAAMRLIDRNPDGIDALLLDVQLPDQDGFAVLGQVKRRSPRLPVVMMTGHGSIPGAADAIRSGAAEYVTKPLRPVGLVDTVRRAVAGGPRASRGGLPPRVEPVGPAPPPRVRPGVRVEAESPNRDARRRIPVRSARCPHCLSDETSPSRWRPLDYVLAAFQFRPYRCRICYLRFRSGWLRAVLSRRLPDRPAGGQAAGGGPTRPEGTGGGSVNERDEVPAGPGRRTDSPPFRP